MINPATLSSGMETAGLAWLSSGTMVSPLCPPTTGIVSLRGSFSPVSSAVKVDARTTSSVVTPNSLRASNTLWALRISAAMGTVELTGLEMTST